MDPIEKAIRNAFEKGNADDRAFRERVYRSAFAALDRALQANPGVTVEAAIRRRKAMQAKISEIESEFLPAVDSVAPTSDGGSAAPAVDIGGAGQPSGPAAAPAVDAPGAATGRQVPAVEVPSAGVASAIHASGAQAPVGTAPSVDMDQAASSGRVEPTIGALDPQAGASSGPSVDMPRLERESRSEAAPADTEMEPALTGSRPARAAAEVTPDRDERRARRRFPTGLVLGILLLVIIAAAAWWALRSGLLRMPEGGIQSPPAAADDSGEMAPAGEAGPQKPGAADQSRNWIVVFSPSDPTHVSTPSDARAEVMQDESGSFLRIRSGGSGSAVSFDVGQGVLERLAGKHAVFDIVARAEEGKDTQMSIDCNFGELGDCGRKRYAVGHDRNDYLFEVQFPDKQPGAAGAIAVNSDFDRQGKAVDVYEIKVSIDE
ncbi:MAG: hypothetical protein J0I98_10055 [Mesorhizobium sp.]|nr:hypothetical protein [Mesorhizobium sp.]MBN9243125.1 hypothetical protein [Mesorhizobium sp.]